MKLLKKTLILLISFALCACSSPSVENLHQTDENTSAAEGAQTGTASETEVAQSTASSGTSTNKTSSLSENSTEYEGKIGTGEYNYGEALQKSLLFYELQRSGELPEITRCNWRGNSALSDGADNGVDLTGGLYDAGDNVKFNLPMAYTSSVLAWSVYEDADAYEQSGQLEYSLGTIRWVNEYLIKCHTAENEFYYQVGDGNADHSWWGPCEVMQMNRPSYKITLDNPGSTVAAEAAASLAACSVVFAERDAAFAKECLEHAKQLFSFADKTKSDSGYTAANGFYNSWSGFNDELAWAASWLFTATNDSAFLEKAKAYYEKADKNAKWTMCWDNVSVGAALRLAQITGGGKYKDFLEENMNFWLNEITYTSDGLAWLDQWGSLRYSTTAAFIAAVYSECDFCPSEKSQKYRDFAVSQINYALGSSGRSFVCGFGTNPPEHPHHRTSQGSYSNNMSEPANARHTLYGALVGGPDAGGNYIDTVTDYTKNEVACDYNAGFTGALAKLYGIYGGQTLVNFGAVEDITEDELYVDASINAKGSDFTEIKAIVYNKTGWPARVTDKLELRYFIDLSEVFAAGGAAADIKVTTNYNQGGKASQPVVWDKEKNIYYVSVDFSGEKLFPGGHHSYKREVQLRISSVSGVWDASNDPSYACISGSGGTVRATGIALYDSGRLVFGTEPDGNGVSPSVTVTTANSEKSDATEAQSTQSGEATAQSGGFAVKLTGSGAQGSNLGFTLEITNKSLVSVDASSLKVRYYFTKDGGGDLVFNCDHSAIVNSDQYNALSDVRGAFSSAGGADGADYCCEISCGSSTSIEPGGIWKIQVRINRSDWTNFNPADDFSRKSAENVVILSGGKVVFGNEP